MFLLYIVQAKKIMDNSKNLYHNNHLFKITNYPYLSILVQKKHQFPRIEKLVMMFGMKRNIL